MNGLIKQHGDEKSFKNVKQSLKNEVENFNTQGHPNKPQLIIVLLIKLRVFV